MCVFLIIVEHSSALYSARTDTQLSLELMSTVGTLFPNASRKNESVMLSSKGQPKSYVCGVAAITFPHASILHTDGSFQSREHGSEKGHDPNTELPLKVEAGRDHEGR